MVAVDIVVVGIMVDIRVVATVDNNVVLKVAFSAAFWYILLWGRSGGQGCCSRGFNMDSKR